MVSAATGLKNGMNRPATASAAITATTTIRREPVFFCSNPAANSTNAAAVTSRITSAYCSRCASAAPSSTSAGITP